MKEVHKAATTTGMNLRMLYVGKNNKKEQVQKIIDTIQGEELKIKYWKIRVRHGCSGPRL